MADPLQGRRASSRNVRIDATCALSGATFSRGPHSQPVKATDAVHRLR